MKRSTRFGFRSTNKALSTMSTSSYQTTNSRSPSPQPKEDNKKKSGWKWPSDMLGISETTDKAQRAAFESIDKLDNVAQKTLLKFEDVMDNFSAQMRASGRSIEAVAQEFQPSLSKISEAAESIARMFPKGTGKDKRQPMEHLYQITESLLLFFHEVCHEKSDTLISLSIRGIKARRLLGPFLSQFGLDAITNSILGKGSFFSKTEGLSVLFTTLLIALVDYVRETPIIFADKQEEDKVEADAQSLPQSLSSILSMILLADPMQLFHDDDSHLTGKIEQLAKTANTMRGLDFTFTKFLTLVSEGLKFFYDIFSGDFSERRQLEEDYKVYMSKSTHYCTDTKTFQDIRRHPTFAKLFLEHHRAGEEILIRLLRLYPDKGTRAMALRHTLNSWNNLKMEATSSVLAHQDRNEPISVIFTGTPGIGKTFAVETTSHMLASLTGALDGKPWDPTNHIYRYTGAQFFNNYRNQLVFWVDDLGQIKNPERYTNTLHTLFMATSKLPFPLDMASLDNKETTFFRSDFIILTANSVSQDLKATVLDPNALMRRFEYKIHQTLKPEYCGSDGKIDVQKASGKHFDDIWNFSIGKHFMNDTYDPVSCDFEDDKGVMQKKTVFSLSEVAKFLTTLHLLRQENYRLTGLTQNTIINNTSFAKMTINEACEMGLKMVPSAVPKDSPFRPRKEAKAEAGEDIMPKVQTFTIPNFVAQKGLDEKGEFAGLSFMFENEDVEYGNVPFVLEPIRESDYGRSYFICPTKTQGPSRKYFVLEMSCDLQTRPMWMSPDDTRDLVKEYLMDNHTNVKASNDQVIVDQLMAIPILWNNTKYSYFKCVSPSAWINLLHWIEVGPQKMVGFCKFLDKVEHGFDEVDLEGDANRLAQIYNRYVPDSCKRFLSLVGAKAFSLYEFCRMTIEPYKPVIDIILAVLGCMIGGCALIAGVAAFLVWLVPEAYNTPVYILAQQIDAKSQGAAVSGDPRTAKVKHANDRRPLPQRQLHSQSAQIIPYIADTDDSLVSPTVRPENWAPDSNKNARDILHCISQRNMIEISLRYFKNGELVCANSVFALGVGMKSFVTTLHAFAYAGPLIGKEYCHDSNEIHYKGDIYRCELMVKLPNNSNRIVVEEWKMKHLGKSSDTAFVHCPTLPFTFASAAKYFITQDDFERLNISKSYFYRARTFPTSGRKIAFKPEIEVCSNPQIVYDLTVANKLVDESKHRVVNDVLIGLKGTGFNGMCGIPYAIADNKAKHHLVGIHCAVLVSTVYVIPIFREQIELFLESVGDTINNQPLIVKEELTANSQSLWPLAEAEITHIGQLSPTLSPTVRVSSNIIPSKIAVANPTTKPAKLKGSIEDGRYKHMEIPSIMKQLNHEIPLWSNKAVQRAKDSIIRKQRKMITSHMKKCMGVTLGHKKISDHDNLNGFKLVRKVELGTSPGIPWTSLAKHLGKDWAKGGKHGIISVENGYAELKPEFAAVVEKFDERVKQGIVPTLCQVFLKDERRIASKVEKPRTISTLPYEHTHVMRRYFGEYMNWVLASHNESEIAIGTNGLGAEWDTMYQYLTQVDPEGERKIAYDFESYDKKLPYQLIEASIDIIEDYFQTVAKYYGDNVDELDSVVRRNLLIGLGQAYYILRQSVFFTPYGNPSGQAMTTQLNCLVNQLLIRLAWNDLTEGSGLDFDDHVRCKVYGDDFCAMVSEVAAKYFNFVSIKRYFATHNIIITWPNKNYPDKEEEFLPNEDFTFLKRAFVQSERGWVIGQLDFETIIEMPNWIRQSEIGMSDEELTWSVFEDASVEASAHGENKYNEFVALFECKILRNLDGKIPLTFLEATRKRWAIHERSLTDRLGYHDLKENDDEHTWAYAQSGEEEPYCANWPKRTDCEEIVRMSSSSTHWDTECNPDTIHVDNLWDMLGNRKLMKRIINPGKFIIISSLSGIKLEFQEFEFSGDIWSALATFQSDGEMGMSGLNKLFQRVFLRQEIRQYLKEHIRHDWKNNCVETLKCTNPLGRRNQTCGFGKEEICFRPDCECYSQCRGHAMRYWSEKMQHPKCIRADCENEQHCQCLSCDCEQYCESCVQARFYKISGKAFEQCVYCRTFLARSPNDEQFQPICNNCQSIATRSCGCGYCNCQNKVAGGMDLCPGCLTAMGTNNVYCGVLHRPWRANPRKVRWYKALSNHY